METTWKEVLGCAECLLLGTSSALTHSSAAILDFHRCLRHSMFVMWEQEGELPGTRPKQRQAKSAQI